MVDGTRKIISISEVTGMEGEMITMQEIFAFEQTNVSSEGKVEGYFTARGIRPKFAVKLERMGRPLSPDMFDVDPQAQEKR